MSLALAGAIVAPFVHGRSTTLDRTQMITACRSALAHNLRIHETALATPDTRAWAFDNMLDPGSYVVRINAPSAGGRADYLCEITLVNRVFVVARAGQL